VFSCLNVRSLSIAQAPTKTLYTTHPKEILKLYLSYCPFTFKITHVLFPNGLRIAARGRNPSWPLVAMLKIQISIYSVWRIHL